MLTQIRFRRDISTRWTEINPVLADGEPGFEKNTRRFKVGDGSTRWNDLPYIASADINPEDISAWLGIQAHISDPTPHSVYDDGPSLYLLYENAKV